MGKVGPRSRRVTVEASERVKMGVEKEGEKGGGTNVKEDVISKPNK